MQCCLGPPNLQVCGKAGNAHLLQADKHIDERHRHRYEVNPALIDSFEEAGLRFVGKDESGQRMEVIELPSHPFFVAAQFHPEFKSRPFKPSPLFLVGVPPSVANCIEFDDMLWPTGAQRLQMELCLSLHDWQKTDFAPARLGLAD